MIEGSPNVTKRIPDFFLVGAPRCGTTAMYQYLKAHPQIFMPEKVKEPHYFAPDVNPAYIKRYGDLDAYLDLFIPAQEGQRIGEASTHYLASPHAAWAIHGFNPQAQILIMLRPPAEMLYSLYSHRYQYGTETHPTFEAALKTDVHYSVYRSFARYGTQVGHYFEVFGREAVHVVIFDDLKADVAEVYRRVLEFLNVDTSFQPDFSPANEARSVRLPAVRRFIASQPAWYRLFAYPVARRLIPTQRWEKLREGVDAISLSATRRPPMNPETRRALQQEFLPEIERLSDLLGRDLTHWCKDSF
jgi:hypothetical protein